MLNLERWNNLCTRHGVYGREGERQRERVEKRMPTGISTHTHTHTLNEAIGGCVRVGRGRGCWNVLKNRAVAK